MQIEDGTGKGYFAGINKDNLLRTFSLIEFPMEAFSHKGDAYIIPSDFISLTNIATYSGVLYFKETSVTDRTHVHAIRTSSSQPTLWKLLKNPTAGTLITGGTDLVPNNMNFASGKTLSALSKVGTAGAGLTVTDGTLLGQWQTSAGQSVQIILDGSLILNTGNTLALVCLPSVNPTVVGSTWTVWEEPLVF